MQKRIKKRRVTNHKISAKALAITLSLVMVLGFTTQALAQGGLVPTPEAQTSASESGDSTAEEQPLESGDSTAEEQPLEPEQPLAKEAQPAETEPPSGTEDQPSESEEPAVDEEPVVDDEPKAITLSQTTDDGTAITVEGVLPEGTAVRAIPVAPSAELERALDEAAAEVGCTVAQYTAYDITLLNAKGKEIQPESPVQVTIQSPAIDPEAGDVGVAYVSDDMTKAEVVAEGTNTAEVEHFSTYVEVVLTSPNNQQEDLQKAINEAEDGVATRIALSGNIQMAAGTTLSIPANKVIALSGNYTLTGADGQATITVAGSLELMGGITVTHAAGQAGNGVYVNASGSLTITGGTVSGNAVSSGSGGGVYVAPGGTFAMDGGSISGNTGTGLHMEGDNNVHGGEVIIKNATISSNTSGGIRVRGYDLVLENCTISQNTGNSGVSLNGVGASSGYVNSLTLTGCTITYNKSNGGGGVSVADASFFMRGTGNDISYNESTSGAAGVYLSGGRADSVMEGGNIENNTAAGWGGGLTLYGTSYDDVLEFTMLGGSISNNTAGGYGGGVYFGDQSHARVDFIMKDGKISGNKAGTEGGGIHTGYQQTSWGRVVLSGGEVSGNTANYGGGVYTAWHMGMGTSTAPQVDADYAVILEGDAKISNNEATYGGGGIYSIHGNVLMRNDALISNNTSVYGGGGGVHLGQCGMRMEGGAIDGNQTTYANGGGVSMGYGYYGGFQGIAGTISNNSAPQGGGGIYTGSPYNTVKTSQDMLFYGNTANDARDFGYANRGLETITGGYPACPNVNWQGKSTSIPGTHVLNNYDINHWDGTPPAVYWVTYDGNGNTGGTVPQDPGYDRDHWYFADEVVTAQNSGSLARTEYTFTGWNTKTDGTGTAVAAGTTFAMPALDTTLYAQWQVVTYSVTYAPGLHGAFTAVTHSDLTAGMTTPAAPATPGDAGWVFTGWSPAHSTTVTGTVTYTAQWEAQVTPAATYTVRFVDWNGSLLKSETVTSGGNATPPASPTRAGYAFLRWNGSYTNVTSDRTITALYAFVPGDDVTPTPDPDPTPTPTPASTPQEVLEALTEDEGVDTVTVGDQEVPLAAGTLSELVWALLNLILALIGIVAAVVTAIRWIQINRQSNKTQDEYGNEAQGNRMQLQNNEQDEDPDKRTRLASFIVAMVLAVAGLVFFFVTQDMSRLMVLTDQWTIVNAIILVVEFVGIFFSFKRAKEKTQEAAA